MKANNISNWFKTYQPKKKLPENPKKNVLEHNKFVLRPEDLFGDNGSLENIITSLNNKMNEFRIHEGFKEGWWLNSENERSSMYKPEGIISDNSAAEILNSYLYKEDVNPNTNCIPSGDKKGTELKSGIKPRNYKRVARKIIHDCNLKSDCDKCGESEVLPNIKFFKKLGLMLAECNLSKIPAVIFLHPQNLLQLCPNCEKFYKKMNTKLFQEGNLPSHEMSRIREWMNSGTAVPKARLKNITKLKNFDGKIIFNPTTPAQSYVKRVNEMYSENWGKIGIEEDMFKSHKTFKPALEIE